MTQGEKNRLDKLEDEIAETRDEIKRILSYMENDDKTNQLGLVQRLEMLQMTVNDLIKREEVYKGKATVWGIVGAAIWSGAVGLFWFVIKNMV